MSTLSIFVFPVYLRVFLFRYCLKLIKIVSKENQHDKNYLQKGLGIKMSIDRNTKNNTSIIKIEKNNSGNSGEHKITPENESLSPYLEEMSPEKVGLSPVDMEDLSTKYNSSGDTGHSGDISTIPVEKDKRIGFKETLYYCKQHTNVQNIHLEEIERHIKYSKDHVWG